MKRSIRNRNKYFFYFLVIALFIQLPANASSGRGMWVVRHALLSSDAPEEIIRVSKRLSITDIYVQVRALGKFFFNTENKKVDLSRSPAFRNFVTLHSMAVRHKIRIHAWLNTLYIASSSAGKDDWGGTIHEKYLLRTAEDNFPPSRVQLKKNGIEGYFTDPTDPHNFERLQQEIRFLVDSVGVEGIHLDYFRFPDRKFTYSPKGRTAFILKYHYDPAERFSLADGSENLARDYSTFLQKNMETLLRGLRIVSGKAELTIAVKPDLHIAPVKYYQNWEYWLQQKLCDGVILMNYNPDSTTFYSCLQKVKDAGLNSKVKIGIATYNQKEPEIIDRLVNVEKMDFAGLVLFSFNDIQNKNHLQRQISLIGTGEVYRQ